MNITPVMFDRPEKLRINESVKLMENACFVLRNTCNSRVWSVESRVVVCRVYSVEHRVWRVECRVWSVECGV